MVGKAGKPTKEAICVAERTDYHRLVKYGDSEFRLEAPEQDVRGLDVYDRDGKEIGSVEDLYIDTEERKIRFLGVGAGGFLRIGEKHFMIPVEAVTDVGEYGVTIEHGREKVTESPPFDIDVVPPTTDYQRDIYDYYGYAPAWGPYGSGGV
jgi:sporulation protein YlmC with PRC-barrel domain